MILKTFDHKALLKFEVKSAIKHFRQMQYHPTEYDSVVYNLLILQVVSLTIRNIEIKSVK